MKEDKARKKPYVPPSIESEEVFEGAALACGKCRVGNPTRIVPNDGRSVLVST